MRIGIFSLIGWDFLQQRPHRFAQGLAALGHEVYYVEPAPTSRRWPVTASLHWIRSGRSRQIAPGLLRFPGLVIAPRRDQAAFLYFNRFLEPWMTLHVRRLQLDFAIVSAVEYAPVVFTLGLPFAYDHLDDTQFMEHVLTDLFVEQMEALKSRSEFNIYIQQVAAERDPKGVFVPNGADPDEFFPIEAPKLFDAVVLSNIAKWFDMDSILDSTKNILLIGPMDIDRGDNRERFVAAKRANLAWIPQVEKQIANVWLSRAKVGLVPFKRDHPVVGYAMPIKILEYFLAGLPVVTYRNEGISHMYGDMVTYYARDGSDPPLDEAIELAQQKKRDYRRFALDFNWEGIVDQLEHHIRRCVDPPNPRRTNRGSATDSR